MRVNICDRCEERIKGSTATGTVSVRMDDRVTQDRDIELCHSCTSELVRWLNQPALDKGLAVHDSDLLMDLFARIRKTEAEHADA